MRVAASDVVRTLRDLSNTAVVLLYGDDLGLVRERARHVTNTVLGAENDPFRLSVLAREDHDRLVEEARALSLAGGRRVVRVLDAGDGLVAALSRLAGSTSDALVVLEAGALTARSKLRTLVEKRQDWAAIACYSATPATILAEVKAALAGARCTASSAAVSSLVALLPTDTAARKSELQKLITYAGAGGVIDEAAVDLCVDGGAAHSLSDLFDAALGGDANRAATLFHELMDDGGTGTGIIAALNTHLQRILKLRLLLDSGVSSEAACTMLSPPAFPRQTAGLLRQVNRWPFGRLIHLLESIKAADLACKRAGSRDGAIAGRLILATASRAERDRNP